MSRTVAGIWWSPTTEGAPALAVTAVFFTLGGLAGCFSALRTSEAGAAAMAAFLRQFLAAAQAGALEAPAWGEFLWRSLRWPLGVLLLGFTALGAFAVPALCSVRGFFLAFSIASFARAFGRGGLVLALILLGLPALTALPAFLVLSTKSFSAALTLVVRAFGPGRRELPYHRDDWRRCGGCAAAVCIGLLLERYAVPQMVMGLASSLLP